MSPNESKVEATFYGLLARFFKEGAQRVDTNSAPDVRTLLNLLCGSQEERQRLFDEAGKLRREITILKNGRNILFLKGLDTELRAGDSVAIFPPTHGG